MLIKSVEFIVSFLLCRVCLDLLHVLIQWVICHRSGCKGLHGMVWLLVLNLFYFSWACYNLFSVLWELGLDELKARQSLLFGVSLADRVIIFTFKNWEETTSLLAAIFGDKKVFCRAVLGWICLAGLVAGIIAVAVPAVTMRVSFVSWWWRASWRCLTWLFLFIWKFGASLWASSWLGLIKLDKFTNLPNYVRTSDYFEFNRR